MNYLPESSINYGSGGQFSREFHLGLFRIPNSCPSWPMREWRTGIPSTTVDLGNYRTYIHITFRVAFQVCHYFWRIGTNAKLISPSVTVPASPNTQQAIYSVSLCALDPMQLFQRPRRAEAPTAVQNRANKSEKWHILHKRNHIKARVHYNLV